MGTEIDWIPCPDDIKLLNEAAVSLESALRIGQLAVKFPDFSSYSKAEQNCVVIQMIVEYTDFLDGEVTENHTKAWTLK
jgi:hypothetical protein